MLIPVYEASEPRQAILSSQTSSDPDSWPPDIDRTHSVEMLYDEVNLIARAIGGLHSSSVLGLASDMLL